jgi:hypothetical protein
VANITKLQKRIDALWAAAQPLVEAQKAKQIARMEADVLPLLEDTYKQLASLNRRRYCRSASGNDLSPADLRRESDLKITASELLQTVGHPDGLASPAETARWRLFYLFYRLYGFRIPISQPEYEELLRLEGIIDSYPLKEDDREWSFSSLSWYKPTSEVLTFGRPRPVVSRPVTEELLRYNVNTAISVLIAGEGAQVNLAEVLYKNGLVDILWSHDLIDTVDRLKLWPYSLVIVDLDEPWTHELIRLINSEEFLSKPAVVPFTADPETHDKWDGPCLLTPIQAKRIALYLQRMGLTVTSDGDANVSS